MTDARPANIADTDVYITRAFNAPLALVWRFWTEPELLAKWFGPHDVHVAPDKVSIDMRVGGHWNLTMVDNETGAEYPILSEITEVVEHEYFLGTASAETENGPLNVFLRVQFHDHGDKTRVTLHQGPFSPENRDLTLAGWEESFVKFDDLLEGAQA
jgi:uncharacterized protein YndB with AHSA1/START domain